MHSRRGFLSVPFKAQWEICKIVTATLMHDREVIRMVVVWYFRELSFRTINYDEWRDVSCFLFCFPLDDA